MKRTIKTAIVAGVPFQGDTVAEAKAKGEASISAFVTEAHGIGPAYYPVGNMFALIWPIVDGWQWRVIEQGDTGGNAISNCSQGGTRSNAVADAVFAAVQRQWTLLCDNDADFVRRGFQPLLEDRNTVAEATRCSNELISYCGWQRRYAAAREHGADKNTAHDIACRTGSIDAAVAIARGELLRT